MSNFFIGTLSSVTAAALIYLGRFQLGHVLNLIFHKYFPNISGRYLWVSDEESGSDAYPNQKIYLYLKQVAGSVKGKAEVFSGENLKRIYDVEGSISPTRVLRISYECDDADHHDFGVGLFKLDTEGLNFKGKTSSLCVVCQSTTSSDVFLKKLDQQN